MYCLELLEQLSIFVLCGHKKVVFSTNSNKEAF